MKKGNSSSIIVVAGDFNAKTGGGFDQHSNCMGKYGKSTVVNENGHSLINFAEEHDLFLTNTKFRHKMAHRTTWTAPFRNFVTKNGEQRRNPIRNQIDYILINNQYLRFVTDSRSHGGIDTETDHKLVRMSVRLDMYKLNNKNMKAPPKIKTENFGYRDLRSNYAKKTEELLQKSEKEVKNNTDKWNQIVDICQEAAKETLGVKEKTKKPNFLEDEEIKVLSTKRQHLRQKIESTNNEEQNKTLRRERNEMKNQINVLLKAKEEKEIDKKLEQLENIKNDSNKYHTVMRDMRRVKNKQQLLVTDEEGKVAGTTEKKLELIRNYFMSTLSPENMKEEIINYPPHKMEDPFTEQEITKIAKRLKNGKSPGIDNLSAEYIKYAPASVHEEIAVILNNTAETGDSPEHLVRGLLNPLQKPGKKKGPTTNLRPIILLSILRKILTICMLDRIWKRVAPLIPKSQAAYQPGRGTTEQVLALKILIEKALTSSDYDLYILLLDMSKAFDTVNRKTLFLELEKILKPEELHLLSILTNRPKLSVKLENEESETFETYQGICQGDCLSAVLFIFYLARALDGAEIPQDLAIYLDLQYADDLTYATSTHTSREEIKENIPQRLTDYNLSVNLTKTEECEAPDKQQPPPPPPPPLQPPENLITWSEFDWILPTKTTAPEPNWKNIKLLGSKLDTSKDIDHRKTKVWEPMKTFKNIFTSKRISTQHKVRIFNTYVETAFLYNSEIWTLTPTQEKNIDSFHRRLLRAALNIRYPKKISNEDLYIVTKEKPWSEKIKRRRLNLLGHILRLHDDTPAKRAIQEYLKPHRRPVGKPPLTWITLIMKDTTAIREENNISKDFTETTLKQLSELARERTPWRKRVGRSMVDSTE